MIKQWEIIPKGIEIIFVLSHGSPRWNQPSQNQRDSHQRFHAQEKNQIKRLLVVDKEEQRGWEKKNYRTNLNKGISIDMVNAMGRVTVPHIQLYPSM